MKRILTLTTLLIFLFSGIGFSQKPLKKIDKKLNKTTKSLKPTVKKAAYFDVSKPLREMKPIPGWFVKKEVGNEEVPIIKLTKNENNPFEPQKNQNPNIQKEYSTSKALLNVGVNVEGVKGTDGYGVVPPDPHGDIGLTYYVQMVNNGTEIYNKNTGATVLGPFDSSTFWDGFTGDWTGTNDGDPIVMYDEQADRWVVTQFSVSNATQWVLLAVSTTNDPTGTYYRYAYEFSDMPDYPKLGIFLDSYVLTVNNFAASFTGTTVCALDRTKMLAGPDGTGGNIPSMISFFDDGNNPSIASEFSFTWLPADIEGSVPASGTDIPFVFDMADETYWTKDALVIAEMHVDWVTPGNSTFTLDNEISITQDTDPGGEAPQPSNASEGLDLLNDRMMTRAQFRHFATYDAMVVTRTVDDGSNVAAVRWYELRNSGSGWSIYQQSTYAPGDGIWRFMPVIAMNGYGDIAIAYSTSDGTSVEPSMRAVARYAGDPLNTMTTTETELHPGNTSQDANSYTRWGDYFSLMVDPSDDYTFWFTGEYSDGGWDWVTRVVEFALPVTNPPSITNVSPISLFEDRGKDLTITGSDLTGCTFTLGGVTGSQVSNDGSTAVINFPAGNYVGSTLTATNAAGSDNDNSITVNTRITIPVVSGATTTSDNHPTIQSALDGLYAWYGTTTFDAGDLAGTKSINVYAGTYTDEVTLNSGLNPVAGNLLVIQNNPGDVVTVDATGNDYGFNLSTIDYLTLKGFTVETANLANIYAQGNNVTISYNKTTGSVAGSGIKVETGTPFTITNNLSYSNFLYGIEVLSASNTIKNNTVDNNGGTYTPLQNQTLFSESWDTGDYTGWTTTSVGAVWAIDGTNEWAVLDPTANGEQYSILTYSDQPEIDIRGYTNFEISCSIRSLVDAGTTDLMYGEYKIDDGSWTQFFTDITSSLSSWTTYGTASPIVATGDSMQVRFYAHVNNRNNEYWYLDNIVVIGDQAGTGSNTGAGLYVESGSGSTVENNILVAKAGSDDYYALISPSNSISSDYNTYYTTNTSLFDYNGTVGNTGPIGANDLTVDPAFVGSGDYHIFSQAGSYHAGEWPPLTAALGTWTPDVSTSTAIDGGNSDAFANEPAPNGSLINQGTYGNTVQASKTAAVIADHNWTGTVNSDWQNTGNWDLGTIPLASSNVVIPNVTNQPIINNGITNIAVCNNLTIDASSNLTIDPDGYMTVSGSITNNAGNTGLVINSDANGTGSLIQNSGSPVDATVNCYLYSGASRLWHFVSSPVSAAPISVFTSTSNLYYYDESTDDYWTGTTYGPGSVTGWTAFTSGNMSVNKGYSNNYFTETLNFTGQLNNNTVSGSVSVPYTDYEGSGNGEPGYNYPDMDGWNLIGNPYTSAIDWDNAAVAHATAHLADAVYVWDAAAGTYKSYVNGAGTNDATQYIPAMQGFYVKGDATKTSGILNIGAAARIHNSQAYWKSTNTTPDNFLRLQISTNGYTDETIVRFIDDATFDMDNKSDAYKLFTWNTDVPQIYTNTTNNTEYSINSVPASGNEKFSIPVKAIQTGDNYSIAVTEFNFPNFHLYLKDNLKNITTEIGLNDVFDLTADSSDKDSRFELIFEKSTSEILLAENSTVSLYPNPNNGLFYLTVNNNFSDYKVSITNVTGQHIYNNKFKGNISNVLDLSNQGSGIYFVTIVFNDNSMVTKKIVLQ